MSICEIINMNESIKNKEFESVNEEIFLKKKDF